MANYIIDPSNTSISFYVSYLVIAKVKGDMLSFNGNISSDLEDFSDATIELTLDTNSIFTGIKDRDSHLKSEDFFGTEKFPTAGLVFKTIATKDKNNYTVTADLTIKGITNTVTFDININGKVATTKLIVNRAKYDIKYGSGSFFENLGDKTIYDEFELDVTLNF